jgi:hypothetical protein
MSTGPLTRLETSLDQDCQLVLADDVCASEARSGIQVLPSEAVIERYRCPQDFIDIVSVLVPQYNRQGRSLLFMTRLAMSRSKMQSFFYLSI